MARLLDVDPKLRRLCLIGDCERGYTHLVNLGKDEYITKVANTSDEVCRLIEAGYGLPLPYPTAS